MSSPYDDTDWERHRAFLAVWRTGSLSAAARAMGAAQPTLRRRIDALEVEVGEPLFVRSSDGLAPTARAGSLVRHAEAMEAAAGAFARAASGEADAIAGIVRVAASDLVGGVVLPSIIRNIQLSHPGLRIALSLSDRREDLLASQADIAVRMAPAGAAELIARRLPDMRMGLFAHRDIVARHGHPQSLAEAAALPAVGYETETVAVRRLRAAGLPLPWRETVLASDSILCQLNAIRAGVGMGVSLTRLCAGEPDLVHLLPDEFAAGLETWLVYPKEFRHVRRVRVVFDALAAALGRSAM